MGLSAKSPMGGLRGPVRFGVSGSLRTRLPWPQGYRALVNDVAEVCGSDVQKGGSTLAAGLFGVEAGGHANNGN